MLGGGAALVTGGVVASVVRENDVSIYDDNARCLAPGQTRDQLCGSYRSTADTATVLAVVGYSVGGAAMLASAYLFWRGSVRTPSARAAQTSALCALLPGAVTCGVRF
jgi:hypothetical protein